MENLLTQTGEYAMAVAITVAAFGLRLFRLNHQSDWADESLSVIAARLPFGEIAQYHLQHGQEYTYPPLYTYGLHAWFSVFGSSANAGRMFSAALGSAAVFLLFCLVRRLAGGTTALLAAALFAVSQIGVALSQETRAYALLFVFAIGAAWLLDVALVERRGWAWYAFSFVSAALALTHYHSLWTLIALWGIAVCAPLAGLRALPLRWWIVGLGVNVALVTSWFAAGGFSVLLATRGNFSEMPPYFAASWRTFYYVLGSYDNARWQSLLSAPPSATALMGLFLYGLPALLALYPFLPAVRKRMPLSCSQRGPLLLGAAALLCMAGPVLIAIAFSGIPYDIRYTSPGVGFYCGLAAIGVMRLQPPRVRWQAATLMVTFGLLSLHANYFKPYKENWRDSLAWVAGSVQAGDVAVFVPFGSPPNTWDVYHPAERPLPHAELDEVLERPPAGRVFLLTYERVEWAAKQGREAAKALERTGFKRVERREYHWIGASVWEKPAALAAFERTPLPKRGAELRKLSRSYQR